MILDSFNGLHIELNLVCNIELFFRVLFFPFYFITEFKKVVIVSDSIAKYVQGIEGVDLRSFPGDTISNIVHRLESNQVRLDNYDYILLHVGTNDINHKASFHEMLSDFGNLLGVIRKWKPTIKIIVSSILPRPVDYETTDNPSRRINGYLETVMSKKMKFLFIKSYRPFMFGGKPRRELFAKRDGGLHLNTEGTSRLRYYFLKTIAAMQF